MNEHFLIRLESKKLQEVVLALQTRGTHIEYHSPTGQRFALWKIYAVRLEYVIVVDVVGMDVVRPCPLTLPLLIFFLGHVLR